MIIVVLLPEELLDDVEKRSGVPPEEQVSVGIQKQET